MNGSLALAQTLTFLIGSLFQSGFIGCVSFFYSISSVCFCERDSVGGSHDRHVEGCRHGAKQSSAVLIVTQAVVPKHMSRFHPRMFTARRVLSHEGGSTVRARRAQESVVQRRFSKKKCGVASSCKQQVTHIDFSTCR